MAFACRKNGAELEVELDRTWMAPRFEKWLGRLRHWRSLLRLSAKGTTSGRRLGGHESSTPSLRRTPSTSRSSSALSGAAASRDESAHLRRALASVTGSEESVDKTKSSGPSGARTEVAKGQAPIKKAREQRALLVHANIYAAAPLSPPLLAF